MDHPVDWYVNDPGDHEPCRWFHPRPFTLPEAQDVTGIAIHLQFVPHPLEQVERLERSGQGEVVSSAPETAGTRPAVRQELRSNGPLLPQGTRITQWLVDFGSRTMIAGTTGAADAGRYEDNVAVLDAMMRSMRRVEQPPVPCSAEGMPADVAPQPGLPDAVQQTRREVYRAAVQCDFDRLQSLIPQQDFTYSFGGGNDPTGAWRRSEAQQKSPQPMRYLAGLLRRPYGERQVQGTTHYAWPSAFGYDSWEQVPEPDREALRPLYDEQDFRDFAQFGGYIGYRAVIAQDGTWTAFVAGD